jgi:hypothetical protein
LFSTEDTPRKEVIRLAHYFESEGKKVEMLGFVNAKTPESHLNGHGELYIAKGDLNWWGIPKKEAVSSFCNNRFDYLINLDMKGSTPLQSISLSSKARTRIGKHFENYPSSCDMSIKSDSVTAGDFFNELTKYLK